MNREKNGGTNCSSIHDGFDPELSVNSVNPAVFGATTYIFPSANAGKKAFIDALAGESPKHLIYSRHNHPNAEISEVRLAGIDCKGFTGFSSVFCSGMAGIHTVLRACRKKNKKFICHTSPVYGGTYELLYNELKDDVTASSFNSFSDLKNLYLKNGELGVIYIESPANPTMSTFDIKKIAKEAKKIDPDCIVIVDNTFLGVFQKPFLMSDCVDVVLYSATKFIGGHSNFLAGVVTVKDLEFNKIIKGLRMVYGNILSPESCEKLLTSLATYEIRMKQQQKNSRKIVKFLKTCNQIEKIFYPGKGSIISFTLDGADEEKTFKFLDTISKSHVISQAVSLGGIESLVTHPRTTTHSEMSKELLDELGITENFIRFSVGLEEPETLITLFIEGLEKIK